MQLDDAFDRLLQLGGADLLYSCVRRPRIRKDGNLEALEDDPNVLAPTETLKMARQVLDAKQLKELGKRKHVDFSFTWRERARIRGNAYYQRNSVAISFRLLPLAIPSFDMLGSPASRPSLRQRHHGLILALIPPVSA